MKIKRLKSVSLRVTVLSFLLLSVQSDQVFETFFVKIATSGHTGFCLQILQIILHRHRHLLRQLILRQKFREKLNSNPSRINRPDALI